MFLLVCGGLIEIPTPALIWIKFLHAHPHLPKEGFGACLIPNHPPPSGSGGPEILKADEHIFDYCLQNKRCSASCKLTRAAPGISAS